MGYKQIRYTTIFKTKEEAKESMKKAKAFNLIGIGKWSITKTKDRIDLIFKPSIGLKFALNKAEAMWFQIAHQTETAFREELKTKEIIAFVE